MKYVGTNGCHKIYELNQLEDEALWRLITAMPSYVRDSPVSDQILDAEFDGIREAFFTIQAMASAIRDEEDKRVEIHVSHKITVSP